MDKLYGEIDKKISDDCIEFNKNIESNMRYRNEISSDLLNLEWLDLLENACPYIDNIIRNPKLTLIREENVNKIEKVRKTSVESVKNLAVHSQYIEKIDDLTKDVQPSKLLEVYNVETYNIYENRVIYTLLDKLNRFIRNKEQLIEDYESKNTKLLEYKGNTQVGLERINIKLQIGSREISDKDNSNGIDIENIKTRLYRIKKYTSNWDKSILMKELRKAHVKFIIPPVKKTNLILKNPNFQVAMKVWEFLCSREEIEEGDTSGLDTNGNDILLRILDHSFLMDYFIMDSIVKSKKEQKDNLSKYAFVIVNEQIKSIISVLYSCGAKITDEDIMKMVADAIKNEKEKSMSDSNEIKDKFKSEINDYLERMQDYL